MDSWRDPAMDWQEFQKDLFKHVPLIGKELNVKGIENFVQKAVKHYLPKSMLHQPGFHPFTGSSLDYELFETHRSIFVRCRLPEETSPRSVRFFANRRKLRIDYADHSEEIPLPNDVNPTRTIARFHDGVLEIRLPKSSDSEPFREIFIRDGGK